MNKVRFALYLEARQIKQLEEESRERARRLLN